MDRSRGIAGTPIYVKAEAQKDRLEILKTMEAREALDAVISMMYILPRTRGRRLSQLLILQCCYTPLEQLIRCSVAVDV